MDNERENVERVFKLYHKFLMTLNATDYKTFHEAIKKHFDDIAEADKLVRTIMPNISDKERDNKVNDIIMSRMVDSWFKEGHKLDNYTELNDIKVKFSKLLPKLDIQFPYELNPDIEITVYLRRRNIPFIIDRVDVDIMNNSVFDSNGAEILLDIKDVFGKRASRMVNSTIASNNEDSEIKSVEVYYKVNMADLINFNMEGINERVVKNK